MHRLDARAKLVVTFGFVLAVISHDKYAVAALLPFFVFPLAVLMIARAPLGYLARKMLLVAPFAVAVGIFNPVLDTTPMMRLGEVYISGGWLSLASILLRFVLSIGALLLLVATTDVPALAQAAGRLGMPRVLVVQLLMLHRYLFLMAAEGQRLVQGYRLRNPRRRNPGWRIYAEMTGQWLLRTLRRARRVYGAMRCRGFTGEIPVLHEPRFQRRDAAFVAGWSGLFVLLRFGDPVHWIGERIAGWLV